MTTILAPHFSRMRDITIVHQGLENEKYLFLWMPSYRFPAGLDPSFFLRAGPADFGGSQPGRPGVDFMAAQGARFFRPIAQFCIFL